jgi:hypothetical protein
MKAIDDDYNLCCAHGCALYDAFRLYGHGICVLGKRARNVIYMMISFIRSGRRSYQDLIDGFEK